MLFVCLFVFVYVFVRACVLCKMRLPGILLKCLETDSKTQKVGGGLGLLRYTGGSEVSRH